MINPLFGIGMLFLGVYTFIVLNNFRELRLGSPALWFGTLFSLPVVWLFAAVVSKYLM